MPDDDWALGQNEVDVRNEARRSSMQLGPEFDWPHANDEGPPSRHAFACSDCGGIAYNPSCPYCAERRAEARASLPSVFACRNPEQAWIDESRAEAEREDTANEERTG